jgi:hypothetical protein
MAMKLQVIYGIKCLNDEQLNAVVEWLALLLHIWEVPGSNVGPEIG